MNKFFMILGPDLQENPSGSTFCKFIGLEKGEVVENNRPSDVMVSCPASLTLKFNILKSLNRSKTEIKLPSLPPPTPSLFF